MTRQTPYMGPDRDRAAYLNMRGPNLPALTPSEADECRRLYAQGMRAIDLAGRYGVHKRTIYRALETDTDPVETRLLRFLTEAAPELGDRLAERIAQAAARLLETAFERLQEEGGYMPCRGHYDRPPCDWPVPPIRRVPEALPEATVQRLP